VVCPELVFTLESVLVVVLALRSSVEARVGVGCGLRFAADDDSEGDRASAAMASLARRSLVWLLWPVAGFEVLAGWRAETTGSGWDASWDMRERASN
jgi:hypothetical protein